MSYATRRRDARAFDDRNFLDVPAAEVKVVVARAGAIFGAECGLVRRPARALIVVPAFETTC